MTFLLSLKVIGRACNILVINTSEESRKNMRATENGVGVVIFDDTMSRVLLLKREDVHPWNGLWTIPGGMIEPGEKPEEAAIREAEEETGSAIKIIDCLGSFTERPYTPPGGAVWTYVAKIESKSALKGEYGELRWSNELSHPSLIHPWTMKIIGLAKGDSRSRKLSNRRSK